MPAPAERADLTLPVVEEVVTVEKQTKVTGTVRVRTEIEQADVVVDEPLAACEVEIERVPMDRWIDSPVEVRQDGDTTIVPVMEEVLVTEKRLKLIEEVRITRHRSTRRSPQHVTLRRQQAIIDRTATDS